MDNSQEMTKLEFTSSDGQTLSLYVLEQTRVNGTDYIQVHPTYLYESLWNLALLFLMLGYRKHKKFEGEMWLLYLGGYGLGRAWIEGIRTDTLFIPHTTIAVSQVLAIVLFVVAVVTDVLIRLGQKKKMGTTPTVEIAATKKEDSEEK